MGGGVDRGDVEGGDRGGEKGGDRGVGGRAGVGAS